MLIRFLHGLVETFPTINPLAAHADHPAYASAYASPPTWIVLKETPELQRSFANFIDRIYYKSKSEVERLYREAKSTEEVTAMLSKNVERFIEEWKAEGEAEGIAKGKRQVAYKLMLDGMSIARIAEITGLQEEEIKLLRKSILN